MSKIHVTKGGANHGPFTVEEINAKLKSGEFEATDKSWMDGMEGWVPLSDKAFVEAGVELPPPKRRLHQPNRLLPSRSSASPAEAAPHRRAG